MSNVFEPAARAAVKSVHGTLPPCGNAIVGDFLVFRGDGNDYEVYRGFDPAPIKVIVTNCGQPIQQH